MTPRLYPRMLLTQARPDDTSDMSEQEESFIDTLVALARRDAERASDHPESMAQRSVALWMLREVERHADEMQLPSDVARSLRNEARSLRSRLGPAPAHTAA